MKVKFKKTISILLFVLCVLSIFPVGFISASAQTVLPDYLKSFELVAESGNIELYADMTLGLIAVYDKTADEFWCGFARNVYEDEPLAKSTTRNKMMSTVIVTYTDSIKAGVSSEKASHIVRDVYLQDEAGEDVRDEEGNRIIIGVETLLTDTTVVCTKISNGVKMVFTFGKGLGFVIPVEFVLKNGTLEASIIVPEIKENTEKVLSQVSLLPYMGSASTKEEGYMLIPDGSGAIIDFNNGKSKAREYTQYVFGRDTALIRATKVYNTETASLNVFGINKVDKGMTAIITQGETRSILNGFVSGQKNSYNGLYSTFIYRDSDTVTIKTRSWQDTNYIIYEPRHVNIPKYTVRYIFTSGKDESSYTGMAKQYRDYLINEKGFTKTIGADSYPMFIDLFGCYKVTDYFIGIAYKRTQVNTSFKEALEIFKEMESEGINQIVGNYMFWGKGGIDATFNVNAKADRAMGSKKDLNNLIGYAKENNIPLSFDTDLMILKSTSLFGYSKDNYATRTVSKDFTTVFRYDLVSGNGSSPKNILTPRKIESIVDKYLKNYSKLSANATALTSLTKNLYSDLGDKQMDREEAKSVHESVYAKLKNAGSLYVKTPNAPAIPYATNIADIPTMSSRYDITDRDVPFYAIVLHGQVQFSLPDVNASFSTNYMFLKALETGACLKFTYSYKDTEQIYYVTDDIRSLVSQYFYTDYTEWKDTAIDMYKKVSPILKQVSDKYIVDHEIPQYGTAKTVFEGGITIIVNYNNFDVVIDGNTIGANNYLVIGGK